jgi:hypothetical protein
MGAMTFTTKALSMMGLFATLSSIMTFSIMTLSIGCHYAECRAYLNVMRLQMLC